MNKKITVIIPMYNEEKNIRGCLSVLSSQTDQHFAVIFIDDGSTDQTVDILVNYLEEFPPHYSYKIKKQKNKGAAEARKTGINLANTEYVLVLDCDDRISDNSIETHHQSIMQYNPDIILPKALVQRIHHYDELKFFSDQIVLESRECLKNSLGTWKVHGWMCAKKDLFLKSYKTYEKYNVRQENYVNNDEVLVRLNFLYADIVVQNKALYFYENNEASTTKRLNPNRYLLGKNVQILYEIFGRDFSDISIKMKEEYINILWDLLKYVRRHGDELPNRAAWVTQIRELVDFIRPELSTFKFKSFKMISRKWLALIFSRML